MNLDKQPLRYSKIGEIAARSEPIITQLMADALKDKDLLSLAAGFTDNQTLPFELIQSALSKAGGQDASKSFLQYGTNAGREGLREEVLNLLKSYPDESRIDLGSDSVLITNGSQQALYITAQLFCEPGDIVLVESPSYFVFLELIKGLGLKPVSIPCCEKGMIDWNAFEALASDLIASGEINKVKLMYVMGVFANPSSRSIVEADKIKLAEFVRKLPVRLPVIEDMAYRELYFGEPFKARSCLALSEWDDLPLLYSGTFTKPFATGIKVGFVVSRTQEWIDGIARIKGHQDFGTSHLLQAILEQVIQSGEYEKHLNSVRPHYEQKAAILNQSLIDNGLAELGWKWESAQGGLLMWAKGPAGTDTRISSDFHKACLKNLVIYVPGDLCFAEGEPYDCVRLSFGALPENKLIEAGKRFCEAARLIE